MPITSSRLDAIALARQHIMHGTVNLEKPWVAPWLVQSWQRCLSLGLQPDSPVNFDLVSKVQAANTREANIRLVQTAQPVLESLGRAIANTRFFAILTNAQGVVVDASGAIDRSDPRAHMITRTGANLSERSIGTTAIGIALAELQPVWIHQGEHFFAGNSIYSCAGAPLFGPDGDCVGMLDVTGIDTQERPELKHLVRQSACKIENALLIAKKHALILRLNWPGNAMGSDADGILCLDVDGWVTGANRVGRQMVPGLNGPAGLAVHISEVFGVSYDLLFDTAGRPQSTLEIPLWSGLRLQALCILQANEHHPLATQASTQTCANLQLKDIETALIHKTVTEARGNVAEAARLLGISRATVYRKLGQRAAK